MLFVAVSEIHPVYSVGHPPGLYPLGTPSPHHVKL